MPYTDSNQRYPTQAYLESSQIRSALLVDLIDQPILFCFHAGHEIVAITVFFDLSHILACVAT